MVFVRRTPWTCRHPAGGRWQERLVDLGLVDQIGDFKDAIKVAAKLANLQDYNLDFRQRPMDTFEKLAQQLSSGVAVNVSMLPESLLLSKMTPKPLDKATKPLQFLQKLNDPQGLYLFCAECIL